MNTKPPRIGIVSLGCPRALIDSERIISSLRSEGYELTPDYAAADVVIVNTCGFLNSAQSESLDAIGEAMQANGRIIVTGCMGADAQSVRKAHPNVLSVTGPQQYEQVVTVVHAHAPPPSIPFGHLVPQAGLKLTPRHYAYLKISEGCDHTCRFCIVPSLRGGLSSRPIADVMSEAELLVEAGVQELIVVSQDLASYGADLTHGVSPHVGGAFRAPITDLAEAMSKLGIWIRLLCVYPFPHVDSLIPMMAEQKLLPYLDLPLQHASPSVLKAMQRPALQENMLHRMADWRHQVPDLTIRSTFLVGFPGETEEDFQYLLDWLPEAQLDRIECFKFEAVSGARAAALPGQIPEEVKEDRWQRLMTTQADISEVRMKEKIGWEIDVLVDEVDAEGAIGRSMSDAPGIDGCVFLNDETELEPGDMVRAEVAEADHFDLWARVS